MCCSSSSCSECKYDVQRVSQKGVVKPTLPAGPLPHARLAQPPQRATRHAPPPEPASHHAPHHNQAAVGGPGWERVCR